MAGAGESTKPAPPIPAYLSEQMSVARMVEALEALRFNKREEARLVLDPGMRDYLVRASRAAAADHLDAKVRHVWRSIKPR